MEVEMAVVLKTAMNALAAIKKIGIPQHQYDWLASSGVQVKLLPDKFVFTVPAQGGTPAAAFNVPVTLTQLQAIHKNHLSHHDKLQLANKLASTIWQINNLVQQGDPQAYAVAASEEAESKAFASGVSELFGALGKLPPLAPVMLEAAPAKPGLDGWGTFDLGQLKSAPLTKLRNATMMYQPVSGTSVGSRYFVVALNQDIRVAARLQGKGLSIRVEGPNFAQHAKSLSGCGFKVMMASEYASLHLNVDDDKLAARTVGAVLMAIGVEFGTPLPNIKHIRGH